VPLSSKYPVSCLMDFETFSDVRRHRQPSYIETRGCFRPHTIRVDQGCQFTSKELDLWAYASDVTLDFSRPGKPTDNAYIESFNVKVCCLASGGASGLKAHVCLHADDFNFRAENAVES